MSRIVLGCVVDGFSGPESLNQRSVIVLEKIASLNEQLTKAGHYVEIWVRPVVAYRLYGVLFYPSLVVEPLSRMCYE